MAKVYGVNLKLFLLSSFLKAVARKIDAGANKQEVLAEFPHGPKSFSIGYVLRELGPDWMEGVLERSNFQLYSNRKISSFGSSDVLLGTTEDLFSSEPPFPIAFERVAKWHNLKEET